MRNIISVGMFILLLIGGLASIHAPPDATIVLDQTATLSIDQLNGNSIADYNRLTGQGGICAVPAATIVFGADSQRATETAIGSPIAFYTDTWLGMEITIDNPTAFSVASRINGEFYMAMSSILDSAISLSPMTSYINLAVSTPPPQNNLIADNGLAVGIKLKAYGGEATPARTLAANVADLMHSMPVATTYIPQRLTAPLKV